MSKHTQKMKLAFSCLVLVVFIIGAASCASSESSTLPGNDASRDGAQIDNQSRKKSSYLEAYAIAKAKNQK